MRILTLLLLLSITMVLSNGCSSDPVDPSTSGQYTGTNGFVINGDTFSNTTVNFSKASVEYLDANNSQLGVMLDLGTLDGSPITLVLALPNTSPTTGEFSWVDDSNFLPTNAYLTVAQEEDVPYSSKTGSTKITTVGAKGGQMVGTFSGTVQNADHSKTYTINGKFTAFRVD